MMVSRFELANFLINNKGADTFILSDGSREDTVVRLEDYDMDISKAMLVLKRRNE